MKPAIIIVGVVSLVVAGGTGIMLSRYIDQQTEEAMKLATERAAPSVNISNPARAATTGVLVAAIPIEVGKVIEPAMLEWQEWPQALAATMSGQGVITASEGERANAQHAIEGSLARVVMLRGEPFTSDRVIRREQGSILPVLLAPGHRSVTIPVEAVNSAGGMIQPGDRVDILLSQDVSSLMTGAVAAAVSLKPRDVEYGHIRPRYITETIMTDMKVIAAERRLNAIAGSEVPIPANVSLEVTPEQAERLVTAGRMGKFVLIMRPLQTIPDPEREGPIVTTDLQVVPKTRAALLNVDPNQLNLHENPFYPFIASKPEETLDPIPVAAEDKQSITVYRGVIPTTVDMLNGKPVVTSGVVPVGSSRPPAPINVVPVSPPGSSLSVKSGPGTSTPPVPAAPAEDDPSAATFVGRGRTQPHVGR